jgi:TPR repeat protein
VRRSFLVIAMLWRLGGAADSQAGVEAYNRGDYATAYREWLPLAQQGALEAQFNLGPMYPNGRGVAEDDAEAVRWS